MQRRKIQADCFKNGRLHRAGAGDQQYQWESSFHFVSYLSKDHAEQYKGAVSCMRSNYIGSQFGLGYHSSPRFQRSEIEGFRTGRRASVSPRRETPDQSPAIDVADRNAALLQGASRLSVESSWVYARRRQSRCHSRRGSYLRREHRGFDEGRARLCGAGQDRAKYRASTGRSLRRLAIPKIGFCRQRFSLTLRRSRRALAAS